jgi:carbamoyl-phosphate synthase large subunit
MMWGMTVSQEIEPAGDVGGHRVLVTGGAGVIARELLELLSARGAIVLSVDRMPLDRSAPHGVEHLVADLATADLGPLIAFSPDIVVHLAATFERSTESAEFWPQNWNDNVIVTHRLAEMAAGVGSVRAFVFASSYLIYRTSQYLFSMPQDEAVALTEDSDIDPRNLCGAAKLYGEAELGFARDVLGGRFRTVAARIFRVYGRGSRDVVSRWIRAAFRGDPIDVYHPENRFDYVYSRDVAEGLLRMAIDQRAVGVLNLATGRARPVSDVITAVESATGRALDRRTLAVDEPYEASRADVGRLRERLAWVPDTALEDGIEALVAHERAALGQRREAVDVGA